MYGLAPILLDRPPNGGLAPLAASGSVWAYGGKVRRWKDSRAWSDARNLGHGFNVYRETTKDPAEMVSEDEAVRSVASCVWLSRALAFALAFSRCLLVTSLSLAFTLSTKKDKN